MGLFEEVCEFQRIITKMERRGILLDERKCHENMALADRKSDELERHLQELAGYPINLRSPKQLMAWLGVRSTAKECLKDLQAMAEWGDRPEIQLLLDYRMWAKSANTFYRPYLAKRGHDGALHPNLRITGTYTGRLSCANPNLQQVPRGNPYNIKDVFIARPGFTLVEADFSQAEMRVAAHYGKEGNIATLFEMGADLHTAVAEEMGVPRTIAKNINFSVIYGIGPGRFSSTYRIPFDKACEYLNKYHSRYPGFRKLAQACEQHAEEKEYIMLFTGRVRHFNSPRAAIWKASSNLVQGSTAEMMRVSIQRMDRELPHVEKILTVHDSVMCEVPDGQVNDTVPEIVRIMEDQPWCRVPIKADVKTGKCWGDLKPWGSEQLEMAL